MYGILYEQLYWRLFRLTSKSYSKLYDDLYQNPTPFCISFFYRGTFTSPTILFLSTPFCISFFYRGTFTCPTIILSVQGINRYVRVVIIVVIIFFLGLVFRAWTNRLTSIGDPESGLEKTLILGAIVRVVIIILNGIFFLEVWFQTPTDRGFF